MNKIEQTFGYKTIWLAVKKTNIEKIKDVLKLQDIRLVDWNIGIKYTNEFNSYIMVTEAYNGWNFMVGLSLPDISYHKNTIDWIAEISRELIEVYYFISYRTVDLYGFVISKQGFIERAYCYHGEKGSVLINIGETTKKETELGYNFASNEDELFDDNFSSLEEEEIITLAESWTMNPEDLLGCPAYDVLCGKLSGFYVVT